MGEEEKDAKKQSAAKPDSFGKRVIKSKWTKIGAGATLATAAFLGVRGCNNSDKEAQDVEAVAVRILNTDPAEKEELKKQYEIFRDSQRNLRKKSLKEWDEMVPSLKTQIEDKLEKAGVPLPMDNLDIANQLTDMVRAQEKYGADSKKIEVIERMLDDMERWHFEEWKETLKNDLQSMSPDEKKQLEKKLKRMIKEMPPEKRKPLEDMMDELFPGKTAAIGERGQGKVR